MTSGFERSVQFGLLVNAFQNASQTRLLRQQAHLQATQLQAQYAILEGQQAALHQAQEIEARRQRDAQISLFARELEHRGEAPLDAARQAEREVVIREAYARLQAAYAAYEGSTATAELSTRGLTYLTQTRRVQLFAGSTFLAVGALLVVCGIRFAVGGGGDSAAALLGLSVPCAIGGLVLLGFWSVTSSAHAAYVAGRSVQGRLAARELRKARALDRADGPTTADLYGQLVITLEEVDGVLTACGPSVIDDDSMLRAAVTEELRRARTG